jgi:hypothetical protein
MIRTHAPTPAIIRLPTLQRIRLLLPPVPSWALPQYGAIRVGMRASVALRRAGSHRDATH